MLLSVEGGAEGPRHGRTPNCKRATGNRMATLERVSPNRSRSRRGLSSTNCWLLASTEIHRGRLARLQIPPSRLRPYREATRSAPAGDFGSWRDSANRSRPHVWRRVPARMCWRAVRGHQISSLRRFSLLTCALSAGLDSCVTSVSTISQPSNWLSDTT
jgi:hypothetical protein